MFKSVFLILFMLLGLHAQSAPAREQIIARVKTVENDAEIIRDGVKIKVELNTPLYRSDTLTTGKNSSMGIAFTDNTIMSIGNDSVLALDEFLYALTHDGHKRTPSISKGRVMYVSGISAKPKLDEFVPESSRNKHSLVVSKKDKVTTQP